MRIFTLEKLSVRAQQGVDAGARNQILRTLENCSGASSAHRESLPLSQMPADRAHPAQIRVIAVIEAHTVTGPAKNLIRFCRMAAERNCDISLLSFVRPGPPGPNQFIDAVRDAGLHIDVIHERHAFDPQVLQRLRKLFRERPPDIIQTHGVKSHFLIRLIRPTGTPWLAYHHGYTTENLKMRLYNQLDRWSLPAADRVVTVCTPFANLLAHRGVKRGRISVVPNSIEPHNGAAGESSSALRDKWSLSGSAPIILAVGRHSSEKGHTYFIAAAHVLRQEHPELDFQMLLVGDGPERRRLESQVDQYGLRDRVRFTGHQRNAMPYYALADLFVLPSLSEGSPNVLLEAMLTKTPIIASAVGGVPETVEHGNSALLVQPRDPAALARAIVTVLRNSELANALRNKAYATVLTRFSPECSSSSFLSIYGDLLARA